MDKIVLTDGSDYIINSAYKITVYSIKSWHTAKDIICKLNLKYDVCIFENSLQILTLL